MISCDSWQTRSSAGKERGVAKGGYQGGMISHSQSSIKMYAVSEREGGNELVATDGRVKPQRFAVIPVKLY